ncbi:MAG: hypothetical protein U1E36_02665 [Rickettsiales bacterium]
MADENNGGDFLVNTAKFLGKVTLAVVATAVFADDIGKGIATLGEKSDPGFWKSLTEGFGGLFTGASTLASTILATVTNAISPTEFKADDFTTLAKDGAKLGLSGVGSTLWDQAAASPMGVLIKDHPLQASAIAVGGGAVAEVVGRWTQKVAHDNAVNVNINPAYKS